ncbi:MAG TPA: glycosyhydrolase, partial [Chitinophagaceae bacterium]|nr:glycosyhydrolase [Chitinophagaceae bacterium]
SQYVSIGADHYTKAVNSNGIKWTVLPDLGRTGSAITTYPVTAPPQQPGGNAPHTEYEFYTYSSGDFRISAFFSPTLNFHNTASGLQYAISVDGEAPRIISINNDERTTEGGINYKWVGDNIIIKTSSHQIKQAGKHTLKYWLVNSGLVLQKLVLDFGGLLPSYLGPEETINKIVNK